MVTTYNYNTLDQLQNIQTSDGVIQASYTYDISGNRATMTSYGNTVTYTYDGQNNMISTGEGITYTYDAKGERLTKTVGSDTYSYYYNGVNLLFTKKNGETEAQYFYAGDEVYGASGSDATAYWYCTDVRGSVTSIHKGMTDSSTWTELEYSYAYDAYGETTVSEEATTHTLINDVAYTGAIIDRETGLYYLMSRYYDPSIGQFTSEDSYRGDGEAFWHLYAYCDGDPINKTDRTGNLKVSAQEKKDAISALKKTNLYKYYRKKNKYAFNKTVLYYSRKGDVYSISIKSQDSKLPGYTFSIYRGNKKALKAYADMLYNKANKWDVGKWLSAISTGGEILTGIGIGAKLMNSASKLFSISKNFSVASLSVRFILEACQLYSNTLSSLSRYIVDTTYYSSNKNTITFAFGMTKIMSRGIQTFDVNGRVKTSHGG